MSMRSISSRGRVQSEPGFASRVLIKPFVTRAGSASTEFDSLRLHSKVCLWRAPDDDPGVGLLTADAVSIPLNRSTGLVIFPQIPSGTTGESAPTTQYHRWFLAHTWMSAEELLILHPDDELPDWLPVYREARLGTLGLPDIQQFIDIGEAWRTHRNRSQPAAEASS
ncbi:hypothetical protein [Micromonospora avicenniae]|uniref:Uncharacterized protein n=1 Tax=Micromonospora avicenniae TaxID=1198245 RepID=A0A1N7A1P1_9ACTN|nr:hypothetical protein [Micromonospora avicenniae]SIR32909.1 hypothetical protein SAMN05444858_108207 [Micromonospora avicenniae]